jgi:hypothetical protein
LHEGFNLGLDMAVAESVPSLHKVKERMQEAPKDGPLENLAHGDNLWPDAELWDGATEFVSIREAMFRNCQLMVIAW